MTPGHVCKTFRANIRRSDCVGSVSSHICLVCFTVHATRCHRPRLRTVLRVEHFLGLRFSGWGPLAQKWPLFQRLRATRAKVVYVAIFRAGGVGYVLGARTSTGEILVPLCYLHESTGTARVPLAWQYWYCLFDNCMLWWEHLRNGE